MFIGRAYKDHFFTAYSQSDYVMLICEECKNEAWQDDIHSKELILKLSEGSNRNNCDEKSQNSKDLSYNSHSIFSFD